MGCRLGKPGGPGGRGGPKPPARGRAEHPDKEEIDRRGPPFVNHSEIVNLEGLALRKMNTPRFCGKKQENADRGGA